MSGTTPGVGRRPVLDRITWITYVQISLFAFFLYGFGATQALLRDEQGTSRTVASLHATVFAIANIVAGLLVSRLIARWGRSRVIRYAIISMCIGIGMYTAPFGMTASLIGTAVVAASGVSLIATANAFILDYQGPAGPSALTQANALAALFGFVVPLVIGVTTALTIGWRAGLWALIVALIISEILRTRNEGTPRAREVDIPRTMHSAENKNAHMPARFWWSLAVVALLLATEFSLTLWSVDLLRERAGLGAAAAAASLAAVTGGMFIGRLYGSKLAQTRGTDNLLITSILIALAGFTIAWLSTTAWVIVVALFIMGLGISIHWPIGVSRAVATSGGLIDRAAGLSSVAAGAAGGIAPFLLGAASDIVGFHTAFLIVPILLLSALILIVVKPAKFSETITN